MQSQRIGHKIKGFYRIASYALRMEQKNATSQHRLKILTFWIKHGLEATQEAFGVSRRTLYRWQKRLNDQGGHETALIPCRRAPVGRRKRCWPPEVIAEIRRLRSQYPHLGKEKLHLFLEPFCQAKQLACPSIRTIGRLIAEAPGRMRAVPIRLNAKGQRRTLRRPARVRKPKGFQVTAPGQCVALDTVERFREGMRRYVIPFKDLDSRFAFAWATTSRASHAAREFFSMAQTVFPYPIQHVLSDNGSEFLKDFKSELERLNIQHFHTDPKTPKMNAHGERFNRSIQEEFVDYHEDILFTDLNAFNHRLTDYLIWFNGQRPHWALKRKSATGHPQLLSPIQFLIHNNHLCHLYWPYTVG
jgi:transposase InsO family protein